MRLAEACGVWGSKTAHKRLTCWFAYVLVVSWQYRRLVTVRMGATRGQIRAQFLAEAILLPD
jgi:hypothetical protein